MAMVLAQLVTWEYSFKQREQLDKNTEGDIWCMFVRTVFWKGESWVLVEEHFKEMKLESWMGQVRDHPSSADVLSATLTSEASERFACQTP